LTVLFACATGLQAQERKPAQEGGQRAGNPLMQFEHIEKDSAKLELTIDQKANLDVLLANTHKQIDPLMEKARAGDKDARRDIQKVIADLRPKLVEAIGQEQLDKLQATSPGGRTAGRQRPDGAAKPDDAPSTALASKVDLATLVPIPELGATPYKGFEGGYYPGGKNTRPAEHEAAGITAAKQIQPLDADGKPSANGKIVLLTCGMSNTTMESQAFVALANADPAKNPKVLIVDGAQGGKTAKIIQDVTAPYWKVDDDRLMASGVTRSQVQVVWLKEADAHPTDAFPKHAQTLADEEANIARLIHERFPNCKQIFVSNRTYGGFATSNLNPEPYAYETGYAVKWVIEKQIKGDKELNFDPAKGTVKAPWMAWGPDLWASGTTPRKTDGFTYTMNDVVEKDRTHPSDSGRKKVAELLLNFFKTDATAKVWFTGKE
jgi:hypothetical protein